MKYRIFMILFCLLSGISTTKADTIHCWDIYTVSLKSARRYQNPYTDIPVNGSSDLVKAVFTGTSGNALNRQISVTGFWNGGQEWQIHFAPPSSGTWKYITVSADKSLNGKKGEINVSDWTDTELNANPVRHGFIKVSQSGVNAGHFFEYSDGHPFLWIGDTWWNWTDIRIHPESFKKLVDNRSEKGFTIGQLFVPGNGWGRESSLLDESYSLPDFDHIKKVEEMISYANLKGITVWIHGWWSRKDMAVNIGPEKVERWWRYLVHRFSAYNVIWVLAGEYNMNNYGGFGLGFWKDLGKMIKNEDPYSHIVSLHNTPPFWEGGAEAPQWSTAEVLHNETWLDYNQSQVGHGKFANEMIPGVVSEARAMNPPKPIVVTEPWYEFREGSAPAIDVRFAAWSSILSGAAGHTYGGGHVWLASVPEAPANEQTWLYEQGFERTTYDYKGAQSMKYLAAFFGKVNWWLMTPHPELVKEYPQPFCLADLGKEYVVYLRYAGTAKVELSGTETSQFEYTWYDPSNGSYTDKQIIKGAGIKQFNAPGGYPETPEYRDWVLYIRTAQE